MKQGLFIAVLCAMMVFCGSAEAQKLKLVKKHPSIGEQWSTRFGLTGKNKPEGFYYRLREEVRVPNLMRSETTSNMQLIISEETSFGAFGLFRSPMSEDLSSFILSLQNKEGKIVNEYDLCKITDEYGLEVQDIRYEDGRFYFNMACPTYSDQYHRKCSRLYCFDVQSSSIVWKTDYLTSNDIIVLNEGYIICSYGFTSEKDFIYLLDKKTGVVTCRMSLDKKADYVEVKDGRLYVIDAGQNVYVYEIE